MEDNYLNNAYYYRGKLIDHFNILEKKIEEYIVNYMQPANDRGIDFHTIVLDRLTFQSKMDCFISITRKIALKSGFKKTEKAKWPQAKLYKLIQDAKDERNRFAHYYLVTPDVIDVKNNLIVLAEFRDGGVYHQYNDDSYNAILVAIATASMLVSELNDLL